MFSQSHYIATIVFVARAGRSLRQSSPVIRMPQRQFQPTKLFRSCFIQRTYTSLLLLILEGFLLTGNVSVGNNVAQLGHALGISSLIVIPGIDLHQRTVNDLRTERIDDGTAGVVGVVRRHEGLLLVAQNALERTGLTGRLEGGIDLLLGGGLLDLKDAVGQTGVEEGDTDGQAVELALELGIDLDDGSGRAGGGRAEVDHAGTSTTEVGLFGVGHVDQLCEEAEEHELMRCNCMICRKRTHMMCRK